MMKTKKALLTLGFALVLAAAIPLRAQTGCDDSPEDPTIVLGLVSGACAIVASLLGARSRKQ